MTNTLLSQKLIDGIRDTMIKDIVAGGFMARLPSLKPQRRNPVLRLYVGHDPYSSIDNAAFIERLLAASVLPAAPARVDRLLKMEPRRSQTGYDGDTAGNQRHYFSGIRDCETCGDGD